MDRVNRIAIMKSKKYCERDATRQLEDYHQTGDWNIEIMYNLAGWGNIELLQYAIQNGCLVDRGGLDAAAREGHMDIVEYLHSTQNIPKHWTTIWNSCIGGHFHITKFLMQNEYPVEHKHNFRILEKHAIAIPFEDYYWQDFFFSKDLHKYPYLTLAIERRKDYLRSTYAFSEIVLENKVNGQILKYILKPYIVHDKHPDIDNNITDVLSSDEDSE